MALVDVAKPPLHSMDHVPSEALSKRRGSQWGHLIHADGKHKKQVRHSITLSQKPHPRHCSSHLVGEADPGSGGVV